MDVISLVVESEARSDVASGDVENCEDAEVSDEW